MPPGRRRSQGKIMWTLIKSCLAALAAWLRITALLAPIRARREVRQARQELARKQGELRALLQELPPGSPEIAAVMVRLGLLHEALEQAREEEADLTRVLQEYLTPVRSAEERGGGTISEDTSLGATPAKGPQ